MGRKEEVYVCKVSSGSSSGSGGGGSGGGAVAVAAAAAAGEHYRRSPAASGKTSFLAV